jgi:hypothetical protein
MSAGADAWPSAALGGKTSLDTFGACPEPGIIALLPKGHKKGTWEKDHW